MKVGGFFFNFNNSLYLLEWLPVEACFLDSVFIYLFRFWCSMNDEIILCL